MSAATKLSMIVLIESELRAAAHALRRLKEAASDKALSDAEVAAATDAAFAACWTALYHLTLDGADETPITVCALPPPRVTVVRGNRAVEEKPQ
mgnify:CR=1 FL=1